MIMLKRQARQEQHRVQGLALLARYGFESFEQVLDALKARGLGVPT
jgi:tRNA isopentenyl-2-thiomethyl-A-37 hydroxylase MiaE